MFLIYKTDVWHSYDSRDLIAVATCFDMAISLCQKKAKKEGSKLSKYQLFNLSNIHQTQGYKGEGEFVIEEVTVNELF